MAAEATPWRAWLASAAVLGVKPASFWRLSVCEWRALVSPFASEALTRAGFENLTRTFPDKIHA